MIRTKIEYADRTWNPVTGCEHECSFCYARRISARLGGRAGYPSDEPFRPTLHDFRMQEPASAKKPLTIFVCSMGDLFGAWVPQDWIDKVCDAMLAAPHHRYLLLTKNPRGYNKIKRPVPDNWWLGTSITGWSDERRAEELYCATEQGANLWLSVEPMIGPVRSTMIFDWINWIVLGAMTGPGADRVIFDPQWPRSLAHSAQARRIPVFVKDNLTGRTHWPNAPRQFPWRSV